MIEALASGLDVEALRSNYPVLGRRVQGKRMVYLDSACTALKPRLVAESLAEFYRGWGGCGGKRSTHLASQEVEARIVEARRQAAEFIGADSPGEIVFTSGTTEAVNMVARAFPYGGRREVVLTEAEHNSVLLPFHEAAKAQGLKLRFCPVRSGRLDLDAMRRLITAKTALVAATRSSNVLGCEFPAAEVGRMAHAQGAYLLVDEAQYLSSHREDVRAMNIDFAVFSAHKLGGPFGVGVLYGKEHLLNRLGRYKTGGGSVKSVEWKRGGLEARYLDAPAGLEPGVPNLAGIAACAEALKFLGALPERAVRAHVAELVRRAAAGIAGHPELRLLADIEDLASGSVVSFYPAHAGFSPVDFNLYLNHELSDRFIALRVGEHCAHLLHRRLGVDSTVRISFFAYNTAEEVDFFLGALESYLQEACP